jgi:hypothetical protein
MDVASMKHLWKRLQKIESALTDSSGFEPYSPDWFTYWNGQWERLEMGEQVPKPPIAFFDAVLAEAERDEKQRQNGTPAPDRCA